MEYHVGLDISRWSCALCIVDSRGKVHLERELPCEIEGIADCLEAFEYPAERVDFEAGALSQHLYLVCNHRALMLFAWRRGR